MTILEEAKAHLSTMPEDLRDQYIEEVAMYGCTYADVLQRPAEQKSFYKMHQIEIEKIIQAAEEFYGQPFDDLLTGDIIKNKVWYAYEETIKQLYI